MSKIGDSFYNLKAAIIGTKTAAIDKQVDSSIQTIQTYTNNVSKNAYIDTLKSLISTAGNDTSSEDVIKDLGKTAISAESFNQHDRMSRYREYDAIVTNISHCKRALKVLVDNIIAPDDVTKRTIQIMLADGDDTNNPNANVIIQRLKDIKNKINIERHIDTWIEKTMKKGDHFIEIIYSPKGQNALTILSEGIKVDTNCINDHEPIHYKINVTESFDNEKTTFVKEGRIILSEYNPISNLYNGSGNSMDFVSPSFDGKFSNTSAPYSSNAGEDSKIHDSKIDLKNKKFIAKFTDTNIPETNSRVELKDLFLAIHDPKYVVRLETERFRTCLGYLVFPKTDLTSMSAGGGLYSAPTNEVDAICLRIINQLQKTVDKSKDNLPKDNLELRKIISVYLTAVKHNEDLHVRYVPPHLMSHWRINVGRYEPYGESIFDCVRFDCKLLMALKTSSTIKFITGATDKRFMYVETGLPRNAKNLVESLKEGMRKRKISIDKFGSVDTIPSHISTFEDIYIPMKDGKEFVRIDGKEFGPNPMNDIEPLKFIRDNIVANLSVPPAFVGLEDNTSNRALLQVENTNFTRTLISNQKEDSELMKDLFTKIYSLIYPNDISDMDKIVVTFPAPKSAPFEYQVGYMQQLTAISETLKSFGVPETWIKKKYLPDFPWDEIEKAAAEEKIKTQIGEEAQEPDPNAMAGGGAMMGGGMGGGPLM